MRPAGSVGEVRQALLRAAGELAAPGRGATLQEIASHACVGYDAARRTIDNMRRGGQLHVCGQRRVGYRNRPVAEYVPAPAAPEPVAESAGYVDLGVLITGWAR